MNDDRQGGAQDRGAGEQPSYTDAPAGASPLDETTDRALASSVSQGHAADRAEPSFTAGNVSDQQPVPGRQRPGRAVAQENFSAGMKAWEMKALESLVSAEPDGRRSMDPSTDLKDADTAGRPTSTGGSANTDVQDVARAEPARLHDTSGGSSAIGSPEGKPESLVFARPDLVVLVSDKVVEGAFEHSDGVVTTRANLSELDDSLLELAAPLIRDVVAAVLGAESARVGLERQTKIYLESGRVGRQWVMLVDSEFADRLGDASTVGYLTQFFGYVVDRAIWSPKMDSIVAVGGIEARLIAIARSLRQSKLGSRQLGSAARVLCTAWQSPIELPRSVGEGRPPQRETQKDEAVGHVTCDDWGERILSVRPFGRKTKIAVSYVQAEGEDDQAATVQEAHRNRTQIYSAKFKATIVVGKVEHRSLISLEPVQPDLYQDTKG
ncbi:MAG: hypothetical protein ACK5X3_21535 [Pseudomonadota bacterium]|jgi:hypothetical protein